MLREKYLPGLHWFIRFCLILLAAAVLWITVAFLIPKILPVSTISNTSKYGIIFRNEKWEGEIKIIGDIWALPGTTVAISPGTKISVIREGDVFNLDWLPWHLRRGQNTEKDWMGVKNGEFFWDERHKISMYFAKVFALGTKEQPIIVEADKSCPETKVEFNVISVKSGIISSVKMSNYRKLSIGDKITVRDSQFRNIGECAICVACSGPSIINNIFENASREYILVKGGSPRISDNLFMASEGKGIVIAPDVFGSPTIYHNNFEMPGKIALEFLNGGEKRGAVVSFNDFAGGSTIKIPCDSKAKFIQNQIKGVIQLAHSGNCVGSLTLGPNYWQSLDRAAILKEKIVDKEPQFEILLPSVLGSSPSGAGHR